jgi:hypothetical protein
MSSLLGTRVNEIVANSLTILTYYLKNASNMINILYLLNNKLINYDLKYLLLRLSQFNLHVLTYYWMCFGVESTLVDDFGHNGNITFTGS